MARDVTKAATILVALATQAHAADSTRTMGEARDLVASYSRAVSDGEASLVALRDWPPLGQGGIRAETVVHEARGDRLPYEIVVTVEGRWGCEGAIKGGAPGSREIVVGSLLLTPAEVAERPGTTGKGGTSTIRPSSGFCRDQLFPIGIRFVRSAVIPAARR